MDENIFDKTGVDLLDNMRQARAAAWAHAEKLMDEAFLLEKAAELRRAQARHAIKEINEDMPLDSDESDEGPHRK